MSDVMFPVFKDESGWTAPVARQSSGAGTTEVAATDSFREMVAAQQTTVQQTTAPQSAARPAAATQAAPAQKQQQAYVFKDEGSAFDGTATDAATAASEKRTGVTLFAEGDEPTAWDLLDFINPLQHIPVVNTLYREITGDKIGALPKLAGSFVVGGPVGIGVAMASLAVEDTTGKDIGAHVLAMFKDDTAPDVGTTQYAQAAEAPVAQPQAQTQTQTQPQTQPQTQAQAEPATAAEPSAAETTVAAAPPKAAEATAAAQPVQRVADTFRPVPPRGTMAVPAAVKPPSGPKVASTATPTPVRTVQTPIAPTSSGAPEEQSNEWFVNRFTDAMNKYDQARKLAPRGGQAL